MKEQPITSHQQQLKAIPGNAKSVWQHPLIGYLLCILLAGLSLFLAVVERDYISPLSFPGVFLTFSVVIIALFWGVGPSTLMIFLSLLILDYMYIPPFGIVGEYQWNGLLQLCTFALSGIIITKLVGQRENARLQAQRAEREAAARAQQLEATFEAMTDGVVVYDKNGIPLQSNKAAHQLFYIKTADNANWQKSSYQESHWGAPRPLTRILKGEALIGINTIDTHVRTPDGRELRLNVSGAPIRTANGTIDKAVLIYHDVTERRKLEQRTRTVLETLLTMAEVLVQGQEHSQIESREDRSDTRQLAQKLVELIGNVVECFHIELLAVSEEERISSLASRGLTAEQMEKWQKYLEQKHLTDLLEDYILLTQLRANEPLVLDGATLPFYTRFLPYPVETVLVFPLHVGKKLIGILLIDDGSKERTYTVQEMGLIHATARLAALALERERLQREREEARSNAFVMHEANRRMEEFLSLVCHELKTPMTIVKGNIQLAERKVTRMFDSDMVDEDTRRRFVPVKALLERAKHQLSMQDRLVSDLLDVSRIQSGRFHLFIERCNLIPIIQEAVEDQQQISLSRMINLSLPEETEVPIHADADRIGQVVSNYLTNALKYSAPEQPIEVCLKIEGTCARLSVCDKGPGLSPPEQEQIWKRFYRVPGIEVQDRVHSETVGLGVGLHICKTIVELHNGEVGVTSTPGEGAVFWFTLPLVEDHLRYTEL